METIVELPARHALSLIDPSVANGLVGYANGVQTTGYQGAPATPAFGGVIDDSVAQAHTSAANGDGALAQNVNSPGSASYASAP